MKNKIILILLLFIIAMITYMYNSSYNPMNFAKNITNPITQETKSESNDIVPINPDLIKGEFIKTGEVIVLKSTATYKDTYKSSNWYSSKTLNIELLFEYGIGIDLSKLNIESIANNIVSIDIPVSQLSIKYMSLQANESQVQSQKTVFASQYTPEDMKSIIANAQEYTYGKINSDKDVMNVGLNNLQELIRDIVMKLGFKDCYFKLII